MIVLNISGYFGRNKQNSYVALSKDVFQVCQYTHSNGKQNIILIVVIL